MKKLSLIALALLLAACNSNDDAPFPGQDPAPVTPPPVTAPPVSVVDAFFAQVLALVAGQPDGEEPIDVSAIVATTPEDTEPVPL